MRFFFLLFLFLLNAEVQSETIKGRIVDKTSNEELAFVNIVITGINTGTVSDEYGYFELGVSPHLYQDTIRFSMVGYKTLYMPVKSIPSGMVTIQMIKEPVKLKEVRIKPLKSKVLGARINSEKTLAGLSGGKTGSEIAVPIYIKKSPTYIKKLYLSVAGYEKDSLQLLVNIYRIEDETPGVSLIEKPAEIVLRKSNNKKGQYVINLDSLGITVKEDFIISISCPDNISYRGIKFRALKSVGTTYCKNTTFEPWKRYPYSTGISVGVQY